MKTLLPLTAILLLAAFLRVYKLNQWMVFTEVQGSEFLAARAAMLSQRLPLSGIMSGLAGIRQGPIYLWILTLLISVFGDKPEPVALFSGVLGIVNVWLVYLIAHRLWGKGAAIIASLTLAVSPLAVVYSRMPSHTSLLPTLGLLFFHSLVRLSGSAKTDRYIWLFASGVLWGALVEVKLFSLIYLPLIPLALAWSAGLLFPEWFGSGRKQTSRIRSLGQLLVVFGIGIALPLLPRIIQLGSNNLMQEISKLVVLMGKLWQASSAWYEQLLLGLRLIWETTRKFAAWESTAVSAILVGIVLLVTMIRIPKMVRGRSADPSLLLIIAWFLTSLAGFSLYGRPTEMQAVMLFPIFPLWIGWAFGSQEFSQAAKGFALTIILMVAAANTLFLWDETFLVSLPTASRRQPYPTYGLPLIERQRIVNLIISDSLGHPFAIVGIGRNGEKIENLDNYRYLFLRENAPLEEGAKLVYTIAEGGKIKRTHQVRTFFFEGALVVREEKQEALNRADEP